MGRGASVEGQEQTGEADDGMAAASLMTAVSRGKRGVPLGKPGDLTELLTLGAGARVPPVPELDRRALAAERSEGVAATAPAPPPPLPPLRQRPSPAGFSLRARFVELGRSVQRALRVW